MVKRQKEEEEEWSREEVEEEVSGAVTRPHLAGPGERPETIGIQQ